MHIGQPGRIDQTPVVGRKGVDKQTRVRLAWRIQTKRYHVQKCSWCGGGIERARQFSIQI